MSLEAREPGWGSFYFYSCHQIPASQALALEPWRPGEDGGGQGGGRLLRETGRCGSVGPGRENTGAGVRTARTARLKPDLRPHAETGLVTERTLLVLLGAGEGHTGNGDPFLSLVLKVKCRALANPSFWF